MNGKKAKMLRKLAGVTKQNRDSHKYFGEESTVRTKEITHPSALGADGKPLVLGKYSTVSYKLHEGARLLNKMLKRDYTRNSKFLRPVTG